MMALLSAAGQRRLDEIVNSGMLCVFDFDGTLAPIMPQPEQARITLAVKKRLQELSEFALIAVVTGRSVADVAERLEFEPHYVVGNHGLEGLPGWEGRASAYETLCRGWEQTIRAAIEDKARFDPGIRLENKQYSLSLHYRLTRDHKQAERQLVDLLDSLSPRARIITGKCVFNILPEDAAGKGAALEELMNISGAPSAIFVGDDVTDEDAFSLPRRNLMTIRIGFKNDSAAKFFLSQRGEIVILLDDLIRRLRLLQFEMPAAQASRIA